MSVPNHVSTCGGDVTFIHLGYNEKLPLNHLWRVFYSFLLKSLLGFWGGFVVKNKQTSVKYCMNFLNDQTVPRLHNHQYNFKTATEFDRTRKHGH